ncbi:MULTISPECIES: hypothetical protein [Methylosinus]|uniref:Uncharacterized protein n=1 Tax=Methylosinus trichosporium (strain ATCC 35070 / NCIMB 11131 / UNIQEM 75 / OB3b) TaxID=595536 RepID=A0A2D2CXE8_METT3|nr:MULTISPECIES: hypothetical protein [Methylosinus]ATQ67405.1 hypothetical protein CQW49_05480 [Methylosinus trichosporium OB3b]OBS51583.1 hypothetical protein A8B73_15315 [Methylosinus sp. 3S-1]
MTDTKKIVEKYEDIESEICDLRNITDIVSSFVEDKLNGTHRRFMHGDQPMVMVTAREANLMTFSIYQVEKLAKELQDKFYAITEARK